MVKVTFSESLYRDISFWSIVQLTTIRQNMISSMKSIRSVILLVILLSVPVIQKSVDPVKLPPLTISGRAGVHVCPADDLREEARQNISVMVQSTLLTQYLPTTDHPCGPGSWRRVAFVNLTDPNQQCPSNWTVHDSSTSGRSCIRPNTTTKGCASTFFTTGSVDYNRVCGRATGTASNTPDSYRETGHNRGNAINDPYVDGISITHGSPRQHIWTYAADYVSNYYRGTVPSFVGEDYFCDEIGRGNVFLWDGEDCPTAACCTLNTPPWFNNTLSSSSMDDIEVRICHDEHHSNEIVGIQLLEVYAN